MYRYWQCAGNAALIMPCMALGLSYITELSLLFCAICLCLFIILSQIIHLPEELPGGPDNPDGNELHPKWVVLVAALLSLFLVSLGWLYPGLWHYVAFIN